MRVAYFGSGEFGVPTLATLAERGHDIVSVATQPDRPAGRGGYCRSTPIKALAEELGLPVFQPEKPNTPDFIGCMRDLRPDLAVVVAYGHLIRRELLDIPRLGFVNLHASLLPAYRGAAPVPWAILKGEATSGASVFRLDERFDTGGVIARAELPIAPDDTAESYLRKLAPIGGRLMADALAALAAGRAEVQPQDDARASNAPKLKKEDGRIDWSLPWRDIERKIRAFQPWPLAFTVIPTVKGEVRVNILRLEAATAGAECWKPGEFVTADPKAGLVVMTGDGPVRLALLQPEGRKPMPDADFLRGTRVLPPGVSR